MDQEEFWLFTCFLIFNTQTKILPLFKAYQKILAHCNGSFSGWIPLLPGSANKFSQFTMHTILDDSLRVSRNPLPWQRTLLVNYFMPDSFSTLGRTNFLVVDCWNRVTNIKQCYFNKRGINVYSDVVLQFPSETTVDQTWYQRQHKNVWIRYQQQMLFVVETKTT